MSSIKAAKESTSLRIAILVSMRNKPSTSKKNIDEDISVKKIYQQVLNSQNIKHISIITDSEYIAHSTHGMCASCCFTPPSDAVFSIANLASITSHIPADIYLHIKGTENLVSFEHIQYLIDEMIENTEVKIGTLCQSISYKEACDPNSIKTVVTENQDVLYFSRAIIPYLLNKEEANYLKNLNIYAYRKDILEQCSSLPLCKIECIEEFEQLRLIDSGLNIRSFKIEQTQSVQNNYSPPTLSDTRLVITDVDGVLTDGSILYNETGECMKKFHVRDGLGIRLLEESGIRVAVLSGRDSSTLRKRISDLGINLYLLGIKDKASACIELMKAAGVTAEQTVCIGDDTIDLPAFEVCGISYTVADAPDYIKNRSTAILKHAGGQGAFRELADAILLAQGKEHVFNSADGFKKTVSNVVQ